MFEFYVMRILLAAATPFEINPTPSQNNLEVLITGVGAAATIYHLTKKLTAQNFDLVIQAGVAGSFDATLQIADVVAVHKDVFADAGAWEFGQLKTLADLKLQNPDEFPYTGGWLVNNNMPFAENIQKVTAVTAGLVTDRNDLIALCRDKFAAQTESMEGAAFHYACLQQNAAFLQLRAISNLVGERDKSKWNMPQAIAKLNHVLGDVIEKALSIKERL